MHPKCEDEASISGGNAKANNDEVNATDDEVNAMIQTPVPVIDAFMPPLIKLMIPESLIMQWTIRMDYLIIN